VIEMERAGWEIVDVSRAAAALRADVPPVGRAVARRADEARALGGERTYRTWLCT
jgi:hypothetical protein